MGMIIGGVIVLLVIVGVVMYFTNAKVRHRVNARAEDASNALAGGLGDVTDDRRGAINERKKDNAELERDLAKVLAEIDKTKEDAEDAADKAQEAADMAKEAVEFGNDTAAMEFLEAQESYESTANTLLEVVEGLEEQFNDLKRQLDSSKGDVAAAERQSTAFEARNAALKIREKMRASSGAFGKKGSLDFSDADAELKQRERELDAANRLSKTAGEDAMDKFRAQKAESARNDKLAALKASMNSGNE